LSSVSPFFRGGTPTKKAAEGGAQIFRLVPFRLLSDRHGKPFGIDAQRLAATPPVSFQLADWSTDFFFVFSSIVSSTEMGVTHGLK
jgi:hypothetical protein